jgi:glyoxylase-like metal-dependent hydrolase (beta-lactamase superfamily II)
MLITIPVVFGGYFETNCYLYAPVNSKALIIDPGGDADKIIQVIEKRRLEPAAIVATHGHPDHILAIGAIAAHFGIPLWVGRGDAQMFGKSSKQLFQTLLTPDTEPEIAEIINAALDQSKEPDRLLSDGDVLEGFGLTVWETPGHSPGGICLVGERVVFTGDTLFAGSVGRWDLPGGDETQLMASIRRLMTLPENAQVYPGHGPATTIGMEQMSNPYITEQTI